MAEIGKFLNDLGRRLEESHGSLALFNSFLKSSLIWEINKQMQGSEINLGDDFTDERSWRVIYQIAAEILFDAALREHSEVHPDIFKEASDLSLAFCEEINESMRFDMEFIPIKSPVDEMIEEGFVEVNDEGYLIGLTRKGEEVGRK